MYYIHISDHGKEGYHLAESTLPRADCEWKYLELVAKDKKEALEMAKQYANATNAKICPVCCKAD
jgi:hypothetical protein